MSDNKFFLSICIPSYNRPRELKRALESVDTEKYADEIQIVICEDCAPKRLEVRSIVEEFKKNSKYVVKYVENEVNLGHGKNWRHCAHEAEGEYLMYVGDDDMVVPNALDKFIDWLHEHDNLGYVCRSYQVLNPDGSIIYKRYYGKDRFYDPGVEGYVAFFMKSNLMTGYTIKREYTYAFEDPSVDYTLLYQMYLMGEICLRYPSGYCNIPIGQLVGDGISYFGANEEEKGHFKQGVDPFLEVSKFNFFFEASGLVDKKNGIDSTSLIKKEWSKYSSYPTFIKYRKIGKKELKQCKKSMEEIGLNCSKYFYFYYYMVLIFGVRICNFGVETLRKILGSRPEL